MFRFRRMRTINIFVGAKASHLGLGTQQLAKEALCGWSILALLYENLEEVTVLVDSAPQGAALALNGDNYLVEEPPVAPRPLASFDTLSVFRAERMTPLTPRTS